jgi:hypothetical protein
MGNAEWGLRIGECGLGIGYLEETVEISEGIKVKEHTTLKEIVWGRISRNRVTT